MAPYTFADGNESKQSAAQTKKSKVSGEVVAAGGLSVPGFSIRPGGVLEWPNKVVMSRGGGEGTGPAPIGNAVRAQPGGSIAIQPLGDSMRCAVDLLPTQGRRPDLDAIAELTLHRLHPAISGAQKVGAGVLDAEMVSYSAMGTRNNTFAVVVEAHGKGELRPLVFMVVKGGLNPGQENFFAEAMRMTEDGTMAFGVNRQGGNLKRPLDSISIEQPDPAAAGTYDSDFLRWVGKSHDGRTIHIAHWRANVKVNDQSAGSQFVLQSRRDGAAYADRLRVTSPGDVELPAEGAGVILHSPNGKHWRVTVDDSGRLAVNPANVSKQE